MAAQDFGERLRIEMARKGWTQKRLSVEFGTREGTISAWMKGTIPDTPNLARLADVLGVDPGYLLFGPPRNTAPAAAMGLIRDVLRQLEKDPDALQVLADDWATLMRVKESESPQAGSEPPQ